MEFTTSGFSRPLHCREAQEVQKEQNGQCLFIVPECGAVSLPLAMASLELHKRDFRKHLLTCPWATDKITLFLLYLINLPFTSPLVHETTPWFYLVRCFLVITKKPQMKKYCRTIFEGKIFISDFHKNSQRKHNAKRMCY